ncbi:hypothetical protein AB0J83_50270 [Actinoplanes sp. NPDC049596]|uniref:hypothetical protein n=1 Tax=unclassified Actinoplanes TaxID=2626549 RepID=UPI0034417E05
MTTEPRLVLEPEAQQIADSTSKPPFLYELGPDGARKVLDDIQAAPIDLLPVDEQSSSSSTTVRPRPGSRSPSSRATRPPDGSDGRAPPTAWTPRSSRSPVTRSAAT